MKKGTLTSSARKTVMIDVMRGDRFVFTLKYEYCPLFKIDLKDVYDKIVEKRPTLKNVKFEMYIDG